MHTIGFVPTCAPNHTRAGHVSDSPTDLMYAGDEPWRPAVLDVGRDDYYHAHRLGCLELAESLYLEGNEPPPPDPEEPPRTARLRVSVTGPGRVRSTPTGIACPPRCSATYALGAHRRPSAPRRRGAPGSWAGPARAAGRRCAAWRMTANRTVRARFRNRPS